jgi:hypothetical protein
LYYHIFINLGTASIEGEPEFQDFSSILTLDPEASDRDHQLQLQALCPERLSQEVHIFYKFYPILAHANCVTSMNDFIDK